MLSGLGNDYEALMFSF